MIITSIMKLCYFLILRHGSEYFAVLLTEFLTVHIVLTYVYVSTTFDNHYSFFYKLQLKNYRSLLSNIIFRAL